MTDEHRDPPGKRQPPHLSERAIESFAFSAEDAMARPADAAHLGACASCQQRVTELQEEREAFLRARPAAAFVANLEQRQQERSAVRLRLPKITFLAPAILATAVLVAGLIFLLTTEPPRPEHPGVRFRGDALALHLHVSRGGDRAYPHDPRTALLSGDLLRFVVSLPRAGHVLVLNLDDRGEISTYYPQQGNAARPLPAGTNALPGSIELDDFVGHELVCLFFDAEQLEAEAVRDALARAYRAANGDLARAATEVSRSLTVRCVRINKGKKEHG